MDTIAEHHQKENRIAELEELLRKALYLKSKWKSKYWALAKEHEIKKPQTRGEKALLLINELKGNGNPFASIREIAKKCFLSEGRVKRLWYS